MKYLIAGRTGSGKDHFVKLLIKMSQAEQNLTDKIKIPAQPLSELKSFTTRPKRFEAEDSHIFITEEEASAYTDKIATTVINGYEYFSTKSQVEENDIYIIDPNGIEVLTQNMPDTDFQIIYIKPDEDLNRRIHAVKRAEDKIKEEEIFDKRDKSEDTQFTEFEDKIFYRMDSEMCFPDNVKSVMIITNDYAEGSLKQHAYSILRERMRLQKMCDIVRACVSLEILNTSENKDTNGEYKIIALREIDGEVTTEDATIEQCAFNLLADREEFRNIMSDYILLS